MTVRGLQIVELQTDATQKELTAHGDFRFPLGVYENAMDQNVLGFVTWHWHDEMQFNYVTKGTLQLSVDAESFVLREGQGIFINSGRMHSIRAVDRPDSTYVCINADSKLFGGFRGGRIEQTYIQPFVKSAVFLGQDNEWERRILEKLQTIFSLYTTRHFAFELDVCSELCAIWSLLVNNNELGESSESGTSRDAYDKIKTILAYLHGHYAEKIYLADIASTVFLSRNECCRLFKKKMHCTIFDYLMEHRLHKSIELLRDGNLSIGAVASAAGFSTASYFTEAFGKYVGCSPKVYRQQLAAQRES